MENGKIEMRCKKCNKLFMNYYLTGENIDLNLQGLELKCEKCKRILRLKKYTEQILLGYTVNGVYKI